MNQVTGTYQNGAVVLNEPVAWPEGMRVEVVCESGAQAAAEDVCMEGSFWQDSPEALPRWIDWFDSLKPLSTAEAVESSEAELRSCRE